MPHVRALSGALGAEFAGVDLSAPLDATVFAEVLAALVEHHVVVLPDQSLSPGAFAAFARSFGPPTPHVLDHLRHPAHPEILLLTNVFEDGKPTGVYDGAAYWHTDVSYEAEPAFATMVYALATPADAADTRLLHRISVKGLPPSARRDPS